jgi:hypothetical protein
MIVIIQKNKKSPELVYSRDCIYLFIIPLHHHPPFIIPLHPPFIIHLPNHGIIRSAEKTLSVVVDHIIRIFSHISVSDIGDIKALSRRTVQSFQSKLFNLR